MNRKLQFLFTALLLLVGVTGAWADNTVKYSTDGGESWTEAADLNALSSVFSGATSDIQVQLLDNQTLTGRVTWGKAYTLTITATKAISISRGSLARTAMWFLNNGTGTLTLGSSDNAITFAGAGHADNQRIFKNILGNESTGRMNIENVKFQNFKFDTENANLGYLFLNRNYNGKLVLKDVTVSNCITTEDAFIKSISTSNDNIYLQGTINFDNCTGTDIYAAARIRLGEIDGSSSTTISASTPISIYWANATTAIATPVVVKATSAMVSNFTLTNENLGLFGNNIDLKLTQAYTLAVSDAKAATLVLPFESKIPSGATCYTLTHTDGSSVVTATEVTGGTLDANTPVYVEANEGSYKFVSTATSGEFATGSDPVTNGDGALTGVYSDLTFTTENIASTYANTYILNKINEKVGFYKAADGLKVGANRCYLTATNVPGAAAARGLEISFDDEVTGLNEVRGQKEEVRSDYFNLAGQRVAQPTKGLYIVNGKKVVIK